MTTSEMIYSLTVSTECPACKGRKKSAMSFCGRCYYKLPRNMQMNLYRLVGEGYEEAFSAAMMHLGADDCEWERDESDGE